MTIGEVLCAIEQANNERLARIAAGQTRDDANDGFNRRLDEVAVDCPDAEVIER